MAQNCFDGQVQVVGIVGIAGSQHLDAEHARWIVNRPFATAEQAGQRSSPILLQDRLAALATGTRHNEPREQDDDDRYGDQEHPTGEASLLLRRVSHERVLLNITIPNEPNRIVGVHAATIGCSMPCC